MGLPKTILLVDDEPDLLSLISFRVETMGFTVITASNGQEALDIIEKGKPDLILLDYRLPIINGYEVCSILKASAETKNIPIIIMTAGPDSLISKDAKSCPMDDYMIKPFEPEDLLVKINKFLPE